jgi:hypothetical protein
VTTLIWIARIIVLLLLIRLVLRLLFPRGLPRSRRDRASIERSGGTLVRDPHCGTYLPQSRAITAGTGASTVVFCSTACRDAWTTARRRPA